MRDDLLDPYSCVDWAVAQLDVLSERIKRWLDGRPYTVMRNENPQSGEERWKVEEVESLPRIINAEAGFIINALRSSLDLLANKLAERNGHVGKKDVYFPICLTADTFNGSGRKKIKRLSTADKMTIEMLQPYCGGHVGEFLWYLHDLDVIRKHRNLVEAHSSPHGIGIYRYGSLPAEFDEIMRKQPPNEGYVLARGPADPNHQIQLRIEVSLGYPGPLAIDPIVVALNKLADTTNSIIKLFGA